MGVTKTEIKCYQKTMIESPKCLLFTILRQNFITQYMTIINISMSHYIDQKCILRETKIRKQILLKNFDRAA